MEKCVRINNNNLKKYTKIRQITKPFSIIQCDILKNKYFYSGLYF